MASERGVSQLWTSILPATSLPPCPPSAHTRQVACILGAALVLFTSRSEGEGGSSYDAF